MAEKTKRNKTSSAPTENSGKTVRGKIENLKPWPKGVSGNPGGRPKKTQLTDACRALLETVVSGDPHGRTYAEKIAEVICRMAIKGDIRAIRELADRAEGRPRQAIQIEQAPPNSIFERRTSDEIDWFAKFATDERKWPTEEEREYFKAHGHWPQER
jgi:hypothetical protein